MSYYKSTWKNNLATFYFHGLKPLKLYIEEEHDVKALETAFDHCTRIGHETVLHIQPEDRRLPLD